MVITLSVLNGFSKMLSLLEGEVNFQQNPYNTSHQALNPRKLTVVRSTAASPLTSVTSKTSSTGGHTPRLTSSDGPLAGRECGGGDARMSPNIPAHQALRLQVETSLRRRPDRDWVRSSGRPRNRWIDQTNSARTISAHLLTYGEQPSSVVTLERRYGPRRLRDDDDDDDE